MIDNYKIAALCVSRIFDDSTHEIVSELNKNIIDKGYRLFVYHTCSDLYWDTLSEKGEAAVFDLIDMRTVDVLIICDDWADPSGEENVIYDETFTNISVSTSSFMIFWANRSLRWGVIGGAGGLGGLGILLLLLKKRKKKDEEEVKPAK